MPATGRRGRILLRGPPPWENSIFKWTAVRCFFLGLKPFDVATPPGVQTAWSGSTLPAPCASCVRAPA
eukprot:8464230-Alexandrium_andersonii.AAC.1